MSQAIAINRPCIFCGRLVSLDRMVCWQCLDQTAIEPAPAYGDRGRSVREFVDETIATAAAMWNIPPALLIEPPSAYTNAERR